MRTSCSQSELVAIWRRDAENVTQRGDRGPADYRATLLMCAEQLEHALEADARAFVALPALIDLLREAATDEYGDTERYLGREWLTKARAALAQADGPKEQP